MRWVRPFLSVTGMLAVTVGFFQSKIEAVAYFGLVSAIIVWWYKSRDDEKKKPP